MADRLRVRPRDVQALVVGEHGTSEVLLWSSATVGGMPVADLLGQGGRSVEDIRKKVERDVRFANITIIEGTGASQYGIGAVSARLVEAVLRDERGRCCRSPPTRLGTKSRCPWSSVLGAGGVQRMHEPVMTPEEHQALAESVEVLRAAAERALSIGTT